MTITPQEFESFVRYAVPLVEEQGKSTEFVTCEKPTKPLFRAEGISVLSLAV